MLAWILFAMTLSIALFVQIWYYLHVQKQQTSLQQTHHNALMAQITEHQAHVRRLQREFEQSRHRESYDVVLRLLPALDALGQAVQSAQDHTASTDDITTGLVYIQKEILKTLQEQGFTPIQVNLGDKFDPTQHEAIGVLPSSEYPPGTIARILRTGWKHRDRLIRATTVQTATPSEPTITPPSDEQNRSKT